MFDFAWDALLTGMGVNFGFVVLIWLWYLATDNPAVIDFYWSVGIVVCGAVYWAMAESVSAAGISGFGLAMAWSVRLSSFLLANRISKREKDPRYAEVVVDRTRKRHLKYGANYLFQGWLQTLIGMTFFGFFAEEPGGWTFRAGVALAVLGILGETLADWQLLRFRRERRREEPINQRGLWKYSRHPNYFFDLMTWTGFGLISFSGSLSWFAWFGPLTMFVIFNFITIPVTERHMVKSRGEAFKEYRRKTSRFFPFPPRN